MGDPKQNPVASGAALSPPKSFTHFGLLEHSLGNLDPGFWTDTGVKSDPALQRRLDAVLDAHPTWAGVRVAIVDLSGATPAFAGNLNQPRQGRPGETIAPIARCLESWETASTGKIGILYAAFQLRFDVLAAALAAPDLDASALKDQLRLKWLKSQVIDKSLPATVLREQGPRVELRGRELLLDGKNIPLNPPGNAGVQFRPPDLDAIFDISGQGSSLVVKFKGEPDGWSADGGVLEALQRNINFAADGNQGKAFVAPLPAARKDGRPFTFFDKLWLAIDGSQNYAADDCLDAIGYLYVNSLLFQSGLFDPRRGGGLWVGRHFGSGNHNLDWIAPPGPVLNTREGKGRGTIKSALSAAAGVAYMTLLEQDRLVDADASRQMKIFLARAPGTPVKGTSVDGSPAAAGISRIKDGFNELEIKRVLAKVGLGSFYNQFDAAFLVVRNQTEARTFRYAVSFLDFDESEFRLNNALFDCIDPP